MVTGPILILGATGVFGSRLAKILAASTQAPLILASRKAHEAKALADQLAALRPHGAAVSGITIALPAELSNALARIKPYAVVHCAGPFQGQDYSVAKAAIAAAVHYVDLADGRDFVVRITSLDELARRAGVAVVSGASTVPALSTAVIDDLTAGWRRIDDLYVAIAPGGRAPLGLAVVRGVLGYAGQELRVFRDGRWTMLRGWGLLRRRVMPGVGARWLSLCDVPDLDLLVSRYAPARSAIFQAGIEPSALHLGLYCLSLLRRVSIVSSLAPLAQPLLFIARLLRPFASDTGGMYVEARGVDATGQRVCSTWSLTAFLGDGPNIPALAAAAQIKAWLGGPAPAVGARPCAGELALAQLQREMQPLRIEIKHTASAQTLVPPFVAALGDSMAQLAPMVRRLHQAERPIEIWVGRAQVAPAANALGRLLARLMSLPPAAADVPLEVQIEQVEDGERWTRNFGSNLFSSRLCSGKPGAKEIVERIGPLAFSIKLTPREGALHWTLHECRAFNVRLPRALSPKIEASEFQDATGRFALRVDVALPLLGRVAHYEAWLEPQAPLKPANENAGKR